MSDVSMSQSLGHDPLCPYAHVSGPPCEICVLISKVRQDQCSLCCTKAEAAITAAEQRGYHEGHGAALIEFILAVVGMDSRRQDEDGQFVVGKGDVERVLGGMVSDNGIYQQAVEKARDNGTEKGLVYGHRIGYAEGQQNMLAKAIAVAEEFHARVPVSRKILVGHVVDALRALQEKQ